jgi:nitrogen fixation NifU-like protein
MAYSEKVLSHYENPSNVGSFDKGDAHVGTGLVGAPACGSWRCPKTPNQSRS